MLLNFKKPDVVSIRRSMKMALKKVIVGSNVSDVSGSTDKDYILYSATFDRFLLIPI